MRQGGESYLTVRSRVDLGGARSPERRTVRMPEGGWFFSCRGYGCGKKARPEVCGSTARRSAGVAGENASGAASVRFVVFVAVHERVWLWLIGAADFCAMRLVENVLVGSSCEDVEGHLVSH